MHRVPGRIGRLRLKGSQSALDLYSVYLTTGSEAKQERIAQCEALARAIAEPEQALSIIGGDWNYTSEALDRWTHEAANPSPHGDLAEHKAFMEATVGKGVFELSQEDFTHRNS